MVALAVALRLTVLPGYMISAPSDGAPAVVMCTVGGAVVRTVDPAGAPTAPDDQRDEHPGKTSVCPFAAAGVALAAPDPRVEIAAPPSPASLPLAILVGLPGQGLAAPPPPATGPPFSV
ncbi:MAG: hypothetical protein Q7T19_02625 [Caulobacter sp.]|nr:hypothetical protein [Caulobacter sp.]